MREIAVQLSRCRETTVQLSDDTATHSGNYSQRLVGVCQDHRSILYGLDERAITRTVLMFCNWFNNFEKEYSSHVLLYSPKHCFVFWILTP